MAIDYTRQVILAQGKIAAGDFDNTAQIWVTWGKSHQFLVTALEGYVKAQATQADSVLTLRTIEGSPVTLASIAVGSGVAAATQVIDLVDEDKILRTAGDDFELYATCTADDATLVLYWRVWGTPAHY